MKITIILASIITFLYFGNLGMNLTEEQECLNWKKQAEEHSTFYLLKWQKMQCDAHNITIINE